MEEDELDFIDPDAGFEGAAEEEGEEREDGPDSFDNYFGDDEDDGFFGDEEDDLFEEEELAEPDESTMFPQEAEEEEEQFKIPPLDGNQEGQGDPNKGNAQAEQKPKERGMLGSILDTVGDVATGIRGAVEPVTEGIQQLFVSEDSAYGKQLAKNHQRRQRDWELASTRSPIAARAGYWSTLLAGSAAVPGGVTGGIAKRMATGALSGAGLGAAEYVPGGGLGDRAQNAAIGGALGGALPGITGAARGLASKVMPSKTRGALNTADEVARFADMPDGQIKPTSAMKAADELDIPLRPSEGLGSKALAADEAAIKLSPKQRANIGKQLGKEEDLVEGAVDKTMDSIVPEGRVKAKADADVLYKTEGVKKVPAKERLELMKNPDIARIGKTVRNRVDSDNVGRGTVDYFHRISQRLGKDIKAAQGAEKGDLIQARKQIQTALKGAFPKYKQAQRISERVILQDGLVEKIGKRARLGGQERLTPAQLRSALAGSKEAEKGLMGAIKRGGGDIKQAQNVLKVLDVKSAPGGIKQAAGRAIGAKPVATQGPLGEAWEALRGMGTGRYNQGVVELLTSPKWAKEVEKLVKIRPVGQRMDKFGALLARVSPRMSVGEGIGGAQQAQPDGPGADNVKALAGPMLEGFTDPDADKGMEAFERPKAGSVASTTLVPHARKKLGEIAKSSGKADQAMIKDMYALTELQFYKKHLSTPKGRIAYMNAVKRNGGNTAKAFKYMKKLEKASIREAKSAAKEKAKATRASLKSAKKKGAVKYRRGRSLKGKKGKKKSVKTAGKRMKKGKKGRRMKKPKKEKKKGKKIGGILGLIIALIQALVGGLTGAYLGKARGMHVGEDEDNMRSGTGRTRIANIMAETESRYAKEARDAKEAAEATTGAAVEQTNQQSLFAQATQAAEEEAA